jgi:hypothetical protein
MLNVFSTTSFFLHICVAQNYSCKSESPHIMKYPSTNYFHQFWRNCQAGTPAEVILGSPKTRHCINFGICRVSLEQGQLSEFCDNKTVAYLRIDQPTNRLLLHFLSCSFTDNCEERFFASGTFKMDGDYLLPKEISSALTNSEDPTNYRIEKGTYPILIDDHFHTVSLRISAAVAVQEMMVLAA